jgi:hypothetical protein
MHVKKAPIASAGLRRPAVSSDSVAAVLNTPARAADAAIGFLHETLLIL